MSCSFYEDLLGKASTRSSEALVQISWSLEVIRSNFDLIFVVCWPIIYSKFWPSVGSSDPTEVPTLCRKFQPLGSFDTFLEIPICHVISPTFNLFVRISSALLPSIIPRVSESAVTMWSWWLLEEKVVKSWCVRGAGGRGRRGSSVAPRRAWRAEVGHPSGLGGARASQCSRCRCPARRAGARRPLELAGARAHPPCWHCRCWALHGGCWGIWRGERVQRGARRPMFPMRNILTNVQNSRL